MNVHNTSETRENKTALLIGSPYKALRGVENDLELMESLLRGRGFTTQRCGGADATRAKIMNALEALVARARPGDAVVIYYSGHGGQASNPMYDAAIERGDRSEPRYYRCLVPMDLGDSSDEDFRGILSTELSVILFALTRKTPNVTVILDCCHSEGATRSHGASRSSRGWIRKLAKPWKTGVAQHLEALRQRGFDVRQLDREANPFVVTLSACGPRDYAHEDIFETPDGPRNCGVMTHAFVRAVTELGDAPLVWERLGARVKAIVSETRPTQRPVVAGPIDRLLFSTETRRRLFALPLTRPHERWLLSGGRLADTRVGDRFLVFKDTRDVTPAARISVTEVMSTLSSITLEPVGPDGLDEARLGGALAYPTEFVEPRATVVVRSSEAHQRRARLLMDELESSAYLRVVAKESARDDVVMTVALENEGVTLRDGDGASLPRVDEDPVKAPVAFRRAVRVRATALARAHTLLSLARAESSGPALDPARYAIKWYELEDSKPRLIERDLWELDESTPLTVCVENHGPTPIFASVLAVFPSGEIELLSRAYPAGVHIRGDEPYWLGNRTGQLRGVLLDWRAPAPREGDRRSGGLVVVVTSTQLDLRCWESHLDTLVSRRELRPTVSLVSSPYAVSLIDFVRRVRP